MSILKLIRGRDLDLKLRALECAGCRGHGPWAPLHLSGLTFTQIVEFTRLVECAHCGERALVDTDTAPHLQTKRTDDDHGYRTQDGNREMVQ